jgi:small subunit ribosomal protein S17
MRTKKGIIVSLKTPKTIVVRVDRYKIHPKYKKRFLTSKKFYAHTEDNSVYLEGQEIQIQETLPVSKLKKWKVVS